MEDNATKTVRHPQLENIAEYFLILTIITIGIWTLFRGQLNGGLQIRLVLASGLSSTIALLSSISAGVFTVEIPTESD